MGRVVFYEIHLLNGGKWLEKSHSHGESALLKDD